MFEDIILRAIARCTLVKTYQLKIVIVKPQSSRHAHLQNVFCVGAYPVHPMCICTFLIKTFLNSSLFFPRGTSFRLCILRK